MSAYTHFFNELVCYILLPRKLLSWLIFYQSLKSTYMNIVDSLEIPYTKKY